MGWEHQGHLRLYERGVTKTTYKGKVRHFDDSSNTKNDPWKRWKRDGWKWIKKIEEQKEQ